MLTAVGIYWGASTELLNRSLVLIVSGWLLIRAHPSMRRESRPVSAGLALLAIALLAMPPAWFLAAMVGPRPVLLWWLALTWLAAVAGSLLIGRGVGAVRAAAFPLFFLLFLLPPPQRLELPMQHLLQEGTTALSAVLLRGVGYAVAREGFVLRLLGGDLGVIEACSGVRSVAALTAIAALLAHLRGFGLLRGIVLVAAGVLVIITTNVLRVTASGVLQESFGVNALHGTAHELLGFAAFLIGLGLLLGLSQLLRPRLAPSSAMATPAPVNLIAAPRHALLAAGLGCALLSASAAAGIFGWRNVERHHETAALEQVAMNLGEWRGEEAPISDEIRDSLLYDRASHRIYRNAIGQEVHVWVIFWSGAGSVRGYHHPDICWPNRGWTVASAESRLLSLPPNGRLPVTTRQFRQGERRQMICYWTQEGNRVWTDADEEAAHLEGTPGHRWIRERLSGKPVEQSGRLAVLIGCELWGSGDYSEQALIDFTRLFAAELYRVMPWALPAER